ncbi:hypothetical protein HGRIS_014331 [Hohenbuehelia grisea]|uniref:Uncharacterized protein n=1 Tax=Hohenbuehelia grisea TaxID=104357 RepID=A0ABR3JTQ3_9AGAR
MLCSFRACFMLVVLAALPMLTLAHGLASSDAHQFHAIEPKTNGARMAMGLPPLPPRRFAHTPGRRHGPTRIHGTSILAPLSSFGAAILIFPLRSVSPSRRSVAESQCRVSTRRQYLSMWRAWLTCPFSGCFSRSFVRKAHNRIRVNRADSDVALGYVSKPDSNQAKGFGITTSQSSALQVRHHEDDGTISVVSPSRYPFIGFIADSSALDGDLRSGSATFLQLAETAHTKLGSRPAVAGNSLDDKLKVP